MQNLNTQSSDQLIYENDLVQLTVLGGLKLEGLDRMRVTLKVQIKDSAQPPIRHNMDLYNDTQVGKFVRKAAERLEIGTSILSASVVELTEQLEEYRLNKLNEQIDSTPKPKQLTPVERETAEQFLQSKNLLEVTNELIGKAGMIGEESNRLLMYLIFTSRKTATPLHVVSLGASGTGKTHLQEKIGELIPEEDRIEITTLTENAFYYFGRQELKNKLILIEDLDGAENSMYALRELQSKKRISKTIAKKDSRGETRSVSLVVEGPVSVAGCTTKEQIYEDNANRSFLIYLDESKEQTDLILEHQRRASAGKINQVEQEQAAELLRNTQRLLEPIKVVNPYAESLYLPSEVFKPRRTNNHYLQFIEAVTFYHQMQREKKYDKATGEEYIETTLEDIENANKLLKHILLRKSDELTGACRNYFEKLKLYLIGEKEKQFTNNKISQLFRIPLTTIKRYHLDLSTYGYLKCEKEKGSKAHVYEVVSYEEYNELQNRINTVLDESLEKLKKKLESKPKPKSPKQPSSKSGLTKRRAVKA
jgi:predicted transcriptional regulator